MKRNSGQTALILILLAAAALIFFAITLNWGRIAQDKTLLTMGADQAASLLASDAASYGEMQKQTYLQNQNQYTALTGTLFEILLIIVAVAVSFIPVGGTATAILIAGILSTISIVMAVANLVLQLVVVSPGITALWNKLQKNQPVQQQFYEQGIGGALQSTVTDQVNITDYFDSNANGQYGANGAGFPNDVVGRFALYYADRLKMLNQPDIPQVVFFYSQVGELINGETCAQNATDHNLYPTTIPLDPSCSTLNNTDGTGQYCLNVPSDPKCEKPIGGGFRLSDPCTDSNPASPTYNPYCDQCCQPVSVPDPLYNAGSPSPLHPSPNISVRPSGCTPQGQQPDTSAFGAPAQCVTNNPYNSLFPAGSNPYTLLYDPTYQEYADQNQPSFLDKFGRDQQAPLPGPPPAGQLPEPPFTPLNLLGGFPNGIYPLFWLTKSYSSEVDNINEAAVSPSQYHWCTNTVPAPAGYVSPSADVMAEFPDLTQLTLPSCSGIDCCINNLDDTISAGAVSSSGNIQLDTVDSLSLVPPNIQNLGLNPSFGENGAGSWLEADNQICSSTFTYNNSLMVAPDGTCQWTNSTVVPASPTPDPSVSTVDSIDDTVHSLSDFINFANTFLGQDVGTLSSTFNSWYNQAAQWIAPACSGGTPGALLFPTFAANTTTCNDGQDGRLLTVSTDLTAWVGQDGTSGVVGNWLKNSYASANAWCVPPEATLLTQNGTNEDAYINSNSGTTVWGDIPHVIACMNYNATVPVGLYQNCLNAVVANNAAGCTRPLTDPSMAACAPLTLGRSLAGLPPPVFTPSSTTTCSSASCPASCPAGSCTNTCPTGSCSTACTLNDCTVSCPLGTCTQQSPSVVSVPATSPLLGTTTTTTNTLNCTDNCTSTTCGCVSTPSNTCPSCTAETACTGSCTQTAATVAFKSESCDPTVSGSYANWVQKSLTFAQAAVPKFTQRVPYLTDIYTRAQAMQSLFAQGNTTLQNFFKPCGASDCSDGGPAAQLMYARTLGGPTATLPNSVIYGWVDKDLPNGHPGYAHIVKVTAYAPGRGGTYTVGAGGTGSVFWSLLPWIRTHTGWFTRSFTLTNRSGPVYVSVKRWDQDHSNTTTFPNGRPLWQFMYHNPKASAGTTVGTGLPASCIGLNGGTIGYGLEPGTVLGLNYKNYSDSPQDKIALGNSFMLNDVGNGKVDPSANTGSYLTCLAAANKLLAAAPESHACVDYVASSNATHYQATNTDNPDYSGDKDYSLKFFACDQLQDDLNYGE